MYIDAKKADGSRAFNSQVYITWEGGEHTATLDKQLNEPATNFPLFKWQKCSLEMRGMASDKVHGLSSSHPDEPNPDGTQSGNTAGPWPHAVSGNPGTSCEFAEALRAAFLAQGPAPTTLTVTSPVTNQAYPMACDVQPTVVTCRGTQNASIEVLLYP